MCNNRLAVRSLTCTLSVLFLVITSGVLSFITVFFLGFSTTRSNVTYLRFKFFSNVHNDRLFLYLSDTKKHFQKWPVRRFREFQDFRILADFAPVFFLSGDSSFKLWLILFTIECVRQINFCRRWKWHDAIYDLGHL